VEREVMVKDLVREMCLISTGKVFVVIIIIILIVSPLAKKQSHDPNALYSVLRYTKSNMQVKQM
jgi:hypothetical protein